MALTEIEKFQYSSFLTYSTYQKNINQTISDSKFESVGWVLTQHKKD